MRGWMEEEGESKSHVSLLVRGLMRMQITRVHWHNDAATDRGVRVSARRAPVERFVFCVCSCAPDITAYSSNAQVFPHFYDETQNLTRDCLPTVCKSKSAVNMDDERNAPRNERCAYAVRTCTDADQS